MHLQGSFFRCLPSRPSHILVKQTVSAMGTVLRWEYAYHKAMHLQGRFQVFFSFPPLYSSRAHYFPGLVMKVSRIMSRLEVHEARSFFRCLPSRPSHILVKQTVSAMGTVLQVMVFERNNAAGGVW
jgi:hypothetical protein